MPLAIIRGGGDLATGVAYRLWKTGFTVIVLETSRPTAIRRTVSAAQAVFEGVCTLHGMTVRRAVFAHPFPADGEVSLLIDPRGLSIAELRPDLLVDAILAKRNCGTNRNMAPRVVGVGPGFRAPTDVHAVVESLRGHNLGRVIIDGEAAPNTGIPGDIAGQTRDRLLCSPASGFLVPEVSIGDNVHKNQQVGRIGKQPLCARIDGVLRGLIHPQVPLLPGMKVGDIDPRGIPEHCFSISDKSLAVGGGVLEAAFADPCRL